MASSLPNLVINLAEGIHKMKYNYEHDYKNCKMCGNNYKDRECYLEYTNIKR